jgi:hypothetical protein
MPITITLSEATVAELCAALCEAGGDTPPATPPGGTTNEPPTTPPATPPTTPPAGVAVYPVDFGAGFATRESIPGGMKCEDVIALRFTVPADFSRTGLGGIGWSEFGGAPTTRFVTISTNPGDFDASSIMTGAISGIGMLQWTTDAAGAYSPDVARLRPGETYYFNLRSTDRTGKLSCIKGRNVDAIILWTMPTA